MKTLNVKKVTKNQVEKEWGYQLPVIWSNTLYVRCNSKGEVNWDKAPIYQPNELVDRGNYVVHQDKKDNCPYCSGFIGEHMHGCVAE